MTRKEAKNELKKYVISSISTEDHKHININVAKRVINEIFDDFEKQIGSKKNTKTCKWRLLPDIFADIWYGECGAIFMFNEGNPKENDFNFCHKCGKKIEEKEDV
jgi:hypothetical protein